MLDFGFYNMDCMEGMKEFPDKYFDLAIVDPPYGINIGKMGYTSGRQARNELAKKRDYTKDSNWDTQTPPLEYFTELFRVSKRQIIWGGAIFHR